MIFRATLRTTRSYRADIIAARIALSIKSSADRKDTKKEICFSAEYLAVVKTTTLTMLGTGYHVYQVQVLCDSQG